MTCQCPLGLIPHFYIEYNVDIFDNYLCQCPLGLIPHFYYPRSRYLGYGFERVSMPSRAYTSFLLNKLAQAAKGIVVSMPSRAYTSFLRYPFKNLDFMRFPEPVFAGIYQNILTTAVFHAC